MSCPVRMDYDDSAKVYVARESRTGAPTGTFKNLTAYDAYVRSIGCETKYPAGTTLVPTGFLEFSARDPVAQSKYDAMSPGWQGVKASEGAITSGAYDLDFARSNPKSNTPPSSGRIPSGTSQGRSDTRGRG